MNLINFLIPPVTHLYIGSHSHFPQKYLNKITPLYPQSPNTKNILTYFKFTESTNYLKLTLLLLNSIIPIVSR